MSSSSNQLTLAWKDLDSWSFTWTSWANPEVCALAPRLDRPHQHGVDAESRTPAAAVPRRVGFGEWFRLRLRPGGSNGGGSSSLKTYDRLVRLA